ncbi:MAG TPA: amidophosphoribosyltransferase [Flavobacteriaceae bacterium]|nr:amidophosphoribosyltransferase [Flavobacteriaceae bacterium]MAY53028.1 amidophosphoribosyltransferase [Flavobacteriaceae bacterium]HBR53194.1 amidophosphoribosyltransferase [Flavobacteriaceae bacterium]
MLNILFPKLCHGCKNKLLKGEEVLCGACRHDLPLQCHHRNNDTAMQAIFNGRIPVSHATALLQFHKKGITQQLLHDLKYRKQEQISFFFGKWLGDELAEIAAYNEIDLVIPVPIHRKKRRQRGYNQVTGFGVEIAKALDIPFAEDVLLKKSATKSQVFKQRFTRFTDAEVFEVANNHSIQGKHILIVDDIVTTGATLETCGNHLLAHGAAQISLATMAITL